MCTAGLLGLQDPYCTHRFTAVSYIWMAVTISIIRFWPIEEW